MLALILLVLFILSGLFSGSETALMALNRYRLRHLADEGHKGALAAQRLLEKPDRLIALILLGNNLVNILITQLATFIALKLYGNAGLAIATGLLTLLLLIYAEVTPKTIAALNSEKIAFPAARIYAPLIVAMSPILRLVNSFVTLHLRLFGLHEPGSGNALSREELRSAVNEASGLIPDEHQSMLLSVLDLEQITVEDIMVPRNELIGIDIDDDWEDIVDQLMQIQYTRMPVYSSSIDNVIGMIHLRKVLPLILSGEFSRDDLTEILREPYFIPEGTSLNRQLLNFQKNRHRMALVVDEYGDIQGLVTLEDLLEEIVGEFTNDPGSLSSNIHLQEDGSALVEGITHIREINRILKTDLPNDGPKTLSGLITEHLEAMPRIGITVLIKHYPIEVIQTKNNRVKTARIMPNILQDEKDNGES